MKTRITSPPTHPPFSLTFGSKNKHLNFKTEHVKQNCNGKLNKNHQKQRLEKQIVIRRDMRILAENEKLEILTKISSKQGREIKIEI